MPTNPSTPRTYRERQPEEVVEAFKYDGGFPLDFLEEDEGVRVSKDPDYSIEVIDIQKDEPWIFVRLGQYIVRFPTLGLRAYEADSFEYQFEEVDR